MKTFDLRDMNFKAVSKIMSGIRREYPWNLYTEQGIHTSREGIEDEAIQELKHQANKDNSPCMVIFQYGAHYYRQEQA